MEMNMEWIGMKNNFKVTNKSFDHSSLETLLRELVVKLRMRKNIARVDHALGVVPHSNSRPEARSIEAAEANESRTSPKPKKKAATTPPRKKLC
eukprot:4496645-Amphidinium_carterae.1